MFDFIKKEMLIIDKVNKNPEESFKQIININPIYKISKSNNKIKIKNATIEFEDIPIIEKSKYSESYGKIEFSEKIIFKTSKNQIITKIKFN